MDTRITPADRIGHVEEYYFSRKLKEIARMNADGGRPVINLGIGGPDFRPSEATLRALMDDCTRPDANGYQSYVGLPELRQAWSDFYRRWYGVELDPEREIQPLIGSKEGIMHVTMALVNPGDRVLVPDPGYPTYTSVSRLCGAEVVRYDLTYEHGWEPDFAALDAMDLTGVKLMWVNYPHMPTGRRATMDLLERIVAFGRRHGIVIVNDNPYSFILNDRPLSIMQVDGAREVCIEFNSMSKTHSMPGWRMGVAVADAEFIAWILRVKTNVDSGMYRPMMRAAAAALRNPAEYYRRQNEAYQVRRIAAEQLMEHLGCTFDPDQSGLFLWGRIPDRYADCEALTEPVLHEARVFLTPGFIFGANGSRFVRISLCAPFERIQEALLRIQAAGL